MSCVYITHTKKEFSTLCEWFVNNKSSIHFGVDKAKSFYFLKLEVRQSEIYPTKIMILSSTIMQNI